MQRSLRTGLSFLLAGAPLLAGAQAGGRGRGGDTTTRVYPLDRIVAVVGKKGITVTELYEQVNDENARRQQAGLPPLDPADSTKYMRRVLDGMVDAQLLLQKADEFKFPVKDDEIAAAADQQIKNIRNQPQFKDEKAFQDALKADGLNSVEELRKMFIDQERRRRMQKMTVDTLTKLGLMPQVSVSEKDVTQAFDSLKATLPPRGPTVTFRQIVVKPAWTDSADARAKSLADSLLTLLKAGANFDTLAARFSEDTSTAKLGGDLGWFRRGAMVEQFDRAAFSMTIGQLSPLVKTEYGYHIIHVDRLRPGEVRARHILIMPKKGPSDLVLTFTKLERLADAMKAGASFDSIADLYHDGQVHRRKVENKQLTELPPEYIKALSDLKVGEYSKVFEVTIAEGGMNKAAVVQMLSRNETGEWTLDEAREKIRSDLKQAGSWRRLLDTLRKQTYVSIRLDTPPARATQ